MRYPVHYVHYVHYVHLHCPHPVLCAMRSASQWECALEIPEHMAHSMPCAIQSIMSIMSIMSIFTAHSMCIALCALPADGSTH